MGRCCIRNHRENRDDSKGTIGPRHWVLERSRKMNEGKAWMNWWQRGRAM